MARRIVLCIAMIMTMLVPVVRAESPKASADFGKDVFLASLAAPQAARDEPAIEALDPLNGAQLANTACCTQQQIDSCYASVQPGSGCYVERITCWYQNECWCQVFCY